MSKTAELVRRYIETHRLLRPGDRVGVAVSGGADSVALLRLMLELRGEIGIVLSVVHFNHKLRGSESDGDEQFVAELAGHHELAFQSKRCDVSAFAGEKRLSVETAARTMRYAYFNSLLLEKRLSRVATGHTLDDQAETVLMRILRGTGMRGLGAIRPSLTTGTAEKKKEECGLVVRPLLQVRHRELVSYLKELGQSWREDSSNLDMRHTRNRVRSVLVPLLEREFNPTASQRLAELAEIARGEEEFWNEKCELIIDAVVQRGSSDGEGFSIQLDSFQPLPLAMRRRLLSSLELGVGRTIALDFQQIETILRLAEDRERESEKVLNLAGGWKVFRRNGKLRFLMPPSQPRDRAADYEYELPMPGRVHVAEAAVVLEAVIVPKNLCAEYNPDNLLDSRLLSASLRVRNWRAGDRFWPAHTKASKKIKELLQEQRFTARRRQTWPVIVCGEEVVWARGFATPAHLQPAEDGRQAVAIREIALEDSDD